MLLEPALGITATQTRPHSAIAQLFGKALAQPARNALPTPRRFHKCMDDVHGIGCELVELDMTKLGPFISHASCDAAVAAR